MSSLGSIEGENRGRTAIRSTLLHIMVCERMEVITRFQLNPFTWSY